MPHERYERSLGRPWRRTQQYNQSIAPPWAMPQPAPQPAKPARPTIEVPPGATLERDEYRHKTAADLVPPLVWSAVLGAFVGVVAGVLGDYRVGLGTGAGVAALSFLASSLPVVWFDGPGVVAMAERITRLDLDRDGRVGEPEPQRQLVTIRVDDGNTFRYLNDLDVTPELQAFAAGVVDGSMTFSERGAQGVDHAAFVALRDQLLDRGMIAWKNEHSPQAGYHIRPSARRALGELAAYLPLPQDVRR